MLHLLPYLLVFMQPMIYRKTTFHPCPQWQHKACLEKALSVWLCSLVAYYRGTPRSLTLKTALPNNI